MKKLLIATFIVLSVGVVKSTGSGAKTRRVKQSFIASDFLTSNISLDDFQFVEDGVFVIPSHAEVLFSSKSLQ